VTPLRELPLWLFSLAALGVVLTLAERFREHAPAAPVAPAPGPACPFTLPDFVIETSATVAGYRACVDADECQPPGGRRPEILDVQEVEHSRYNVTWDEAHDYCEWAGARLPTEDEWEYACARSPQGDDDDTWLQSGRVSRHQQCGSARADDGVRPYHGIRCAVDLVGHTDSRCGSLENCRRVDAGLQKCAWTHGRGAGGCP
jgi:Sulfatase-modifying factor enzyme 1